MAGVYCAVLFCIYLTLSIIKSFLKKKWTRYSLLAPPFKNPVNSPSREVWPPGEHAESLGIGVGPSQPWLCSLQSACFLPCWVAMNLELWLSPTGTCHHPYFFVPVLLLSLWSRNRPSPSMGLWPSLSTHAGMRLISDSLTLWGLCDSVIPSHSLL